MRRINKILAVGVLLTGGSLQPDITDGSYLHAQSMSLRECIDYALKHNNQIKQQEISTKTSEISLENQKNSYLPTVSANMGQGFGFGRSTGRDGSTVDQTSASTNFGINAGMELFTGLRRPNQIKSNKYSLMAATENLELAKRNISIQVAAGYLQALYSKGLVDVQRQQLALDQEALDRARALYEAGKKPESEVATSEAQVAISEHSLTESMGNETLARLDLMQLLNLEGDVRDFAVVDIDTTSLVGDITPASLVFEQAVENHPSIMGAKYNLESSKYDINVAKSQLMPSISLSASYSNSYYYLFDSDFNQKFSKQLDLNGSEYLGLNISIPIFNRFQTRNSIRQARLQKETREIALSEARQSLFKEIQQAYWNAQKARDNYKSAQKAHASTSLAYSYEAERYAQGKGTAYDLQQARTRLEKSAHDELQAKYEFLMRIKILEFYNGVQM